MTITYPGVNLAVSAEEIDSYIANPSQYTGIKLVATENCMSSYTASYLNADVHNTANKFWVDNATHILYVAPSMLGLMEYRDSVVKLEIKFQQPLGYIVISNCTFVDVDYSCKVATTLESLLDESKGNSLLEKTSTMIHLLHYSLFNGSNCGCNCQEMCDIFVELTRLLTGVEVGVLDDCNC